MAAHLERARARRVLDWRDQFGSARRAPGQASRRSSRRSCQRASIELSGTHLAGLLRARRHLLPGGVRSSSIEQPAASEQLLPSSRPATQRTGRLALRRTGKAIRLAEGAGRAAEDARSHTLTQLEGILLRLACALDWKWAHTHTHTADAAGLLRNNGRAGCAGSIFMVMARRLARSAGGRCERTRRALKRRAELRNTGLEQLRWQSTQARRLRARRPAGQPASLLFGVDKRTAR